MATSKLQIPGQAGTPSAKPTDSFWLKEPSQVLLHHRTTPSPPPSADVVIIGAGVAGAFAARNLAALSPRTSIAMLEAREACSGATGRNGGHCHPKYYSKPIHLAQFELANFERLRKLIADEKVDCDWKQIVGCHAYMDEETLSSAIEGVQKLWEEDADLGSHVQYTRDRKALSKMRLSPDVVGAVVQGLVASVWPYKLVAYLLEKLLKEKPASGEGSFNLQTDTTVDTLQQLEDGSWSVHTTRGGMLSAKQVLLCTNGYTSHLLPSFIELIVPVRGEMAALAPPPSMREERSVDGQYSYAFLGNGADTKQKDEYLIQRPFDTRGNRSGELLFGGGRRYALGGGVGISDDSELDETTKTFLRESLSEVLKLEDKSQTTEVSFEWTGIMGFSRDNAPWIGTVSEELGGGDGLWICAGFTGHGMVNAALCAESVAHQMIGTKTGPVNLPPEYRVSKGRVEEALQHPKIGSVKVNGAAGAISL